MVLNRFMTILTVLSLFLISSCFLGRGGTGTANPALPPPELSVQPNFICAGDDAELSWNVVGAARSSSFCSDPDGGITPRTTCAFDSDCPAAALCLDALCILRTADETQVDFGGGCLESTSTTITAIPGRGGVLVSADPAKTGSVTANPEVDTTYSAFVTGPLRSPSSPATRDVTVVPREGEAAPILEPVNFGPPICESVSSPLSVNLEEYRPEPIIGSRHVKIIEVRNDSPYDVSVETRSPSRGPALIGSGAVEPTGVLLGEIGRDWILSPILDDESIPTDEECETGMLAGGTPIVLPPASLTLTLTCRPERE